MLGGIDALRICIYISAFNQVFNPTIFITCKEVKSKRDILIALPRNIVLVSDSRSTDHQVGQKLMNV